MLESRLTALTTPEFKLRIGAVLFGVFLMVLILIDLVAVFTFKLRLVQFFHHKPINIARCPLILFTVGTRLFLAFAQPCCHTVFAIQFFTGLTLNWLDDHIKTHRANEMRINAPRRSRLVRIYTPCKVLLGSSLTGKVNYLLQLILWL